ncbi:hypothetical protein ACLKA7_013647 [Drosophila subpalustris]
MSFKCLTIFTLVLLIGIAASSNTLQPRPSNNLDYDKDELYKLDDEDGDDIRGDLDYREEDELDLDKLSVEELNKLIAELEATEPRARANRAGNRRTRRRNRSGANNCGVRRNNRRGAALRGGNKRRTRDGKRRRNGAKQVAQV